MALAARRLIIAFECFVEQLRRVVGRSRYLVAVSVGTMSMLVSACSPDPAPTAKSTGIPVSLSVSEVPEPPPITEIIFEAFDGASPPGDWTAQPPVNPVFDYDVSPESLVMKDAGGDNQHLVRAGTPVDASRTYAIESRFRIDSEGGITSFAMLFQVRGNDADQDPIDAWAINVDLQGPVMKHMGFAQGAFRQIGERRVAWPAANNEYRMRIDVHRRLTGARKAQWVSVRVWDDTDRLLDAFEVDYSAFPYQPADGSVVRLGFNSHFADWTVLAARAGYTD